MTQGKEKEGEVGVQDEKRCDIGWHRGNKVWFLFWLFFWFALIFAEFTYAYFI